MPTKYELNEMYVQRVAIGGFASNVYWSSTVYDNYDAWLQGFFNGFQVSTIKNHNYYVRSVRAF